MKDPYPEHRKLHALNGESQTLGEFYEWLESKGYLNRKAPNVDEVLSKYFNISMAKLSAEKDAMLEEIRSANKEKV